MSVKKFRNVIERCSSCNSVIERCSFCDLPAIHWLAVPGAMVMIHADDDEPGTRYSTTVYFCERHEDIVNPLLHEGARMSDPDIELAMYAPNNECEECDPWL
jgi:hypothetical protein